MCNYNSIRIIQKLMQEIISTKKDVSFQITNYDSIIIDYNKFLRSF
jgi:hypothetical protein